MTDRHPIRRAAAFAARLPAPLRWAVVVAGVSVLFYLTLSPSDAVPSVSLNDKSQHALGFFVLALTYGLMFPRRRLVVAVAVCFLGVMVEVLQGIMPFGRDAEFADLIADGVGIALGFLMLRLLAGRPGLPT